MTRTAFILMLTLAGYSIGPGVSAQRPRAVECFTLNASAWDVTLPFWRDAGFFAIPEFVRLDTSSVGAGARRISSSMNLGSTERAFWTGSNDERTLTWMSDAGRTEVNATVSGDSLRGVARFTPMHSSPRGDTAYAAVAGVRSECFDVPQVDSAAVAVAAFHAVMGAPPFAHPAGPAETVCFTLRGYGVDDTGVPANLDGSFVHAATLMLRRTGVIVPRAGCRSETRKTFGTWVLGPNGEPAVIVMVALPQFASPHSARITIAETRAGRWGSIVQCTMVRIAALQPWLPRGCRTLMIS